MGKSSENGLGICKHYTERCGAVRAVQLGTALAPDLAILELRVLSDLGRATALVVERRVSQGGLPHTFSSLFWGRVWELFCRHPTKHIENLPRSVQILLSMVDLLETVCTSQPRCRKIKYNDTCRLG